MNLSIVLWLLSVHFIADFVLQTDWMAVNKSKRWDALFIHTVCYSAAFAWCGWQFALLTFAAHSLTDAITSRISSRLWAANQRHWFFVAIGADQLLHYWQLLFTYKWLH